MFQFLEKQKYPVILSAFGFFIIIISYFEVTDITKLQISRNENPIYSLFVLGILLVVISIILYIIENDAFEKSAFEWLRLGKVKKIKNGFSSIVKTSAINIIFGRIELIDNNIDTNLIVLPETAKRLLKTTIGMFF